MRPVFVDDLRAALARKGFDEADARGGAARVVRRHEGRHDHVVLTLSRKPWWRRLARQPRSVEEVLVGVLWPIGEMAFSRSVPPLPMVPQQVHATTNFTALVDAHPTDPATIAAVVDDWCRRLEDPGHALRVGAIEDPIRRLEFAVVTGDAERGRDAADAARADVKSLPPAPRTQALKRIDLAEGRLPRD